MTEAELTRSVIDLAHTFGWRVAHFRPALTQRGNWITPMQGDKGFPDIVAARRGWVIFAELKVGKNRLEPEQEKWADELVYKPSGPSDAGLMCGMEYHVWTDKDWDDDTIVKALR